MSHSFRRRLHGGELLIGTMVTFEAPAVAEIMAVAGFDWLFLDAEHSTLEPGSIQGLLQAAGTRTPCLVRLQSNTESAVKKALDMGAAGIIAPMTNSAETAGQMVRWSRYAPEGSRGVGLGRAHGYGLTFAEYLRTANENIAVVVQAEHMEAVREMDKIVRIQGLDAVFVGPYDLSSSLGHPGEIGHPEVTAAIDHVTRTCRDAGIPLGVFGISADAVKPYIEKGYTLICAGVDSLMLGTTARELYHELRNQKGSR